MLFLSSSKSQRRVVQLYTSSKSALGRQRWRKSPCLSVAGAYMRNSETPGWLHICTFHTSCPTVGSSGLGEIAKPGSITLSVNCRRSLYQTCSSELSPMKSCLAASAPNSSSYISLLFSTHIKVPPSCHLSPRSKPTSCSTIVSTPQSNP